MGTPDDLVRAAVEVWAERPSATLAEIATKADVGRATLHRHFAGRDELVAAVDRHARERFDAAVGRVDVGRGTGRDALVRLCHEVLALDDLLGLVFADDAVVDPGQWETDQRSDPFALVVERGLADGSLTADLPAEWLATHCWAALFGAWLIRRTSPDLRHRAAELMTRTLLGGVGA